MLDFMLILTKRFKRNEAAVMTTAASLLVSFRDIILETEESRSKIYEMFLMDKNGRQVKSLVKYLVSRQKKIPRSRS